MSNLKGKVAIVTGAGQGIGRGIALRLARDGMHVVVADLKAEQAESVATEIRALGVKVEMHGDGRLTVHGVGVDGLRARWDSRSS